VLLGIGYGPLGFTAAHRAAQPLSQRET
jgi:hypothetical protein